jgi:hypothetical protein
VGFAGFIARTSGPVVLRTDQPSSDENQEHAPHIIGIHNSQHTATLAVQSAMQLEEAPVEDLCVASD